jgi:hypothetical protein
MKFSALLLPNTVYLVGYKWITRNFAPTFLLLCPYFAPTLPLLKTNDITMKRNDKAGITLEFSREFEA